MYIISKNKFVKNYRYSNDFVKNSRFFFDLIAKILESRIFLGEIFTLQDHKLRNKLLF